MHTRAKDTLLLVGGAASEREGLRQIFEDKFYILEAENAPQGVMLLKQNTQYIVAIVADVPLTRGEDLRSLVEAASAGESDSIPVISLIPSEQAQENEEYAFILGAADVVKKPYATLSIRRRVQIMVDLYLHQWDLERLAQLQSETIRQNHQTMIDTLSSIIEYRSTESGNHVLRIRRFTNVLLHNLAQNCPEYGLDDTSIDIITSASALHDIGKISIPDSILNKPGKLTQEEYQAIQAHTTIGSQMVDGLRGMGDTNFLRYVYNITLYHHERYDGSGYPKGLAGEDIPICAQVVGLTDAYDALTTPRVYKQAYPHDTAVNMILNGECGAFSPKLLECFKQVRRDFQELAQRYADGYSPKSDDIRLPLPGPDQQSIPLNSQRLLQSKYQSLLHYTGDTVIEIDLDDKVYHVVFSPNPDFTAIFQGATFETLYKQLFRDAMHPEDVQNASEQYGEGMLLLFRQKGRSFRFRCRLFSPSQGVYQPYEITLQRILGHNSDQRMMLAILHPLSAEAVSAPSHRLLPLVDTPVMYDLAGAVLCCLNDGRLTIREGTATLGSLCLYHPDEVWNLYQNSLLELIDPQDRERVADMLQSMDVRSARAELEFRLLRKNTGPVWVLCRSRFQVGPDGVDYCYLSLTEISDIRRRMDKANTDLHHTGIVLEQPGIIPFRWDVAADSMECSAKWEKRFGYSPAVTNFSQSLASANHFHPDDLPLLREKAAAMLSGSPSEVMDARIAGVEGRYTWSRIRATAVPGPEGKPAYIVGMVYDIDQLKNDALSMQQQAQRDALTQLLNKASTQQQISDYLLQRRSNSLGAMLVMDLDNFKFINDSHGHFYGDAVLNKVGSTLRNLFRSQDILGRIGGDEFMILLKDVPDRKVVEDRCALLVETLEAQLLKYTPELPVSVSVGVALAPVHGESFSELYRHADEALYSAKRRGKNRYCIYDPKEKYQTFLDPSAHSTQIDSDFRITISDDQIARFVFDQLYDSRNLEQTLQEMLAFIGEHMNVSRVYIFENNEDNTACSNTFEWCNHGIEPQKENLQNVSYITDIPGWPEVYDENGILYCNDVTNLSPLVRAVVEPQGIKSMLHSTIREQGVFRGYVGFDECNSNHLWTQGQVSLLKLLSGILSVFVSLLRSQRKAEEN